MSAALPPGIMREFPFNSEQNTAIFPGLITGALCKTYDDIEILANRRSQRQMVTGGPKIFMARNNAKSSDSIEFLKDPAVLTARKEEMKGIISPVDKGTPLAHKGSRHHRAK
jgi:hypothetical protein